MQGLIVPSMPGNLLSIKPLPLCIRNGALPWKRLILE